MYCLLPHPEDAIVPENLPAFCVCFSYLYQLLVLSVVCLCRCLYLFMSACCLYFQVEVSGPVLVRFCVWFVLRVRRLLCFSKKTFLKVVGVLFRWVGLGCCTCLTLFLLLLYGTWFGVRFSYNHSSTRFQKMKNNTST